MAGGIKLVLCDCTGRGLLEAYTRFLQNLAQAPFPIIDFALFPFAVINHGLKQDYMLSPGTVPSESPNAGVILGKGARSLSAFSSGETQGSVSPLSERSPSVRLREGVLEGGCCFWEELGCQVQMGSGPLLRVLV